MYKIQLNELHKVDIQIVECTIWVTKIDENNQSFTYFRMQM